MWKIGYILLIYSIIVHKAKTEIPGCDYFDTVDLTNIEQLEDGSYRYGDIIIPTEKVGTYNFRIVEGQIRESAASHARGCVCHVGSCIRFCCDPRKSLDSATWECVQRAPHQTDFITEMTLNNGSAVVLETLEKFALQQDFQPLCTTFFKLSKFEAQYNWTLFESGVLFRHGDKRNFGKENYCLQPLEVDGTMKLEAYQCPPMDSSLSGYVQVVSVVFMAVTIKILILVLPNLKNATEYKFCLCYMICLTVSFSLLKIELLIRERYITLCHVVAYAGYFFVMSSFLWLLFVNYCLWKKFSSSGLDQVNFMWSHFTVWGTALLLLLVSSLMDIIVENEKFRPRFAIMTCWIDTSGWTAMIYYHGPMLILLIINTIIFVMTSWNIKEQRRKIREAIMEAATSVHYSQDEVLQDRESFENFTIFVNIFLTNGLMWILEVISYLYITITGGDTFTELIDSISSAQGIILFVMIVGKQKVYKALNMKVRIFFNSREKLNRVSHREKKLNAELLKRTR